MKLIASFEDPQIRHLYGIKLEQECLIKEEVALLQKKLQLKWEAGDEQSQSLWLRIKKHLYSSYGLDVENSDLIWGEQGVYLETSCERV